MAKKKVIFDDLVEVMSSTPLALPRDEVEEAIDWANGEAADYDEALTLATNEVNLLAHPEPEVVPAPGRRLKPDVG